MSVAKQTVASVGVVAAQREFGDEWLARSVVQAGVVSGTARSVVQAGARCCCCERLKYLQNP